MKIVAVLAKRSLVTCTGDCMVREAGAPFIATSPDPESGDRSSLKMSKAMKKTQSG